MAYPGIALVLRSEALISQAFHPSYTVTPPTPRKYSAIWDTGATGSVISKKVIDECGLKPIGMAKVKTAKGEMKTPVYLVNIFLPNKVCIYQNRVTKGKIAGATDVLIGMDVIAQGDFAVTHKDGKTAFSFRMPSIERIDFVKQRPPGALPPSPKVLAKVGRNDPCPCGSGKKYKKCCGS